MSDKELTIDGLKKLWNILFRLEREQYMDCVNDARELLERSEPVRHGHWEMREVWSHELSHIERPFCSLCGGQGSTSYPYAYCPYCGAKMDEVSE